MYVSEHLRNTNYGGPEKFPCRNPGISSCAGRRPHLLAPTRSIDVHIAGRHGTQGNQDQRICETWKWKRRRRGKSCSCALTNEGNRRPAAKAKPRTRGVRVDREVRPWPGGVGRHIYVRCKRRFALLPNHVVCSQEPRLR